MGKKKSTVQDALMLTDKGYRDLKKAIAACTLTNFSMFIPAMVMLQVVMELLKTVYRREHLMDKYVDLFRTRHHRRSNRISLQQKRL